MNIDIFDLIKKITERNDAIETYSLEIVSAPESDKPYLTCENGFCFPECSFEWIFSDVSDEEAATLLTAAIENSDLFSFEVHCHLSRLMAVKGRW